jgi:oxygen-independent coproporphyrinogen-3 oxidase
LAALRDCCPDEAAGGRAPQNPGASVPPRELTLEANPESLDEKTLAVVREGGVTRLSLGVQSFNRELRRSLGRRGGNPERALALAAEAFGQGLCLDLMAGLPGQSPELLEADLKKALAFGPGHVSLYSLTVEEATPLKQRLEQGELNLPDAELADSLWLSGRELLEAEGFSQYEVSNFCLSGRESIHNLRYWRMETWLGFGPGASGTLFFEEPAAPKEGVMALRLTVPRDIDAYLDGTLAVMEEPLDRDTLLKETLLMGFRSVYGPDEGLFKKRFGLAVEEAIPKTFSKWRGLGRDSPGLYVQEGRPALTREGLLFLNRFLADAFEEVG